ncbi:putative integral membrane protein [Theileria parva strain Muguga]|uniref:putative integral membrane protein n=1 Tax=Theileria parva strain Muguga TaxID=333668 RepID=UPI001C61A86E|nr:putative integral membrane protein [Theileria parva strain Muguga]KAF5153638.1 putative integral membrane protein [Theileria parva strain Muguga]
MAVDNMLTSPLLDEDSSSYDTSFSSSSISQTDRLILSADDSIESLIDHGRPELNNVDTSTICKNYFYGQLANVMKSAIWWSMIGVLIKNFTSSYYGLSVTRSIFNLSLVLGSFISNLIAEVVNIRKLLCFTTLCRLMIWSVLVPLFYTLSYLYDKMNYYWIFFVSLMLVDGFQISLSNTVDLDYEGIDRMSHQYNILIPDNLHQYMNNVYQLVFDFSFILISVPISIIIFLIDRFTSFDNKFVLLFVFNVTFMILSLASLSFYIFGMPIIRSTNYLAYSRNINLTFFSVMEEFCSKLRHVKDGFRIIYSRQYLFRNLLYFSFETSYENSIFLLIIPLICYNNIWFGDMNICGINLFAVCLISMCKLGTSIYGIYVTYKIKNNANHNLYISRKNTILRCLVFSSLSILLLPGVLLVQRYCPIKWVSLAVLVLGLFLFFTFTTLPKINYSSILQYNISNHPLSYKLFDFVGTFITLVDALVIYSLSYVFRLPNDEVTFSHILTYAGAIYIVYTLIQITLEVFKPL